MRRGYLPGAKVHYVWDFPDGDYPARYVVFLKNNQPVIVVDENEEIISNSAESTLHGFRDVVGHKNGHIKFSRAEIDVCRVCKKIFLQWRKRGQQKSCSVRCIRTARNASQRKRRALTRDKARV